MIVCNDPSRAARAKGSTWCLSTSIFCTLRSALCTAFYECLLFYKYLSALLPPQKNKHCISPGSTLQRAQHLWFHREQGQGRANFPRINIVSTQAFTTPRAEEKQTLEAKLLLESQKSEQRSELCTEKLLTTPTAVIQPKQTQTFTEP